MSSAAYKAANYDTNITVDQSQIDALKSRGTPESNFEHYKKNGASAVEVEALNRFYGKDKVAAAGIGVRPIVPHGASVVPPDRGGDPSRVPSIGVGIYPSARGQTPYKPPAVGPTVLPSPPTGRAPFNPTPTVIKPAAPTAQAPRDSAPASRTTTSTRDSAPAATRTSTIKI